MLTFIFLLNMGFIGLALYWIRWEVKSREQWKNAAKAWRLSAEKYFNKMIFDYREMKLEKARADGLQTSNKNLLHLVQTWREKAMRFKNSTDCFKSMHIAQQEISKDLRSKLTESQRTENAALASFRANGYKTETAKQLEEMTADRDHWKNEAQGALRSVEMFESYYNEATQKNARTEQHLETARADYDLLTKFHNSRLTQVFQALLKYTTPAKYKKALKFLDGE